MNKLKWTSIEDDLPPDQHFVQITKFINDRMVRVPITGRLKHGNWFGVNWSTSHQVDGVTHWRENPQ